jgi:tetratricopeptide (TPR) repeat protein
MKFLKIIILRLGIFMTAFFLTAWLDPYKDKCSEGNKLFNDKKYAEAKSSYQKAEEYAPGENEKKKLSFNRGDSEYMTRNYDNAITGFQRALQSDDPEVQKRALFNMGNTYLKQEKYREAANAYINALKIDPNYLPAKKNLEYMISKNKEKNKDNKNDKSDKNDGKDKTKNENNRQMNKDINERKGAQDQPKMSREQIEKLLKAMKNKPVGRKKESMRDERNALDKNW